MIGWPIWQISPDPDPAREWLVRELSKPEYQPTLMERFNEWLNDLLQQLFASAPVGSPWMLALWLALIAGLVALLVAALVRLRRTRVSDTPDSAVFDERRSALEHRRLAQAALAEKDYSLALIESVRAITAGLIEREFLHDSPAVTSHETLVAASRRFKKYDGELAITMKTFDEVRYGGREATAAQAGSAIDLEAALAAATPLAPAKTPVMAVPR